MTTDFIAELREYKSPIKNLAQQDSLLYRKLLLMAVAHSTSTEAYMESLNIPYTFYSNGAQDIESIKASLLKLYPKKKVRGFRSLKYPVLYDAVEDIGISHGLTVTEVLWELGFQAVIPTEHNEEVILAVMDVLYPNKITHQISSKYPRLFRTFIVRGEERGMTAGSYLDYLGFKSTRRSARRILVVNPVESESKNEDEPTRTYIWLEGNSSNAPKKYKPAPPEHVVEEVIPYTETSVAKKLLALYPTRIVYEETDGYKEVHPYLIEIAKKNDVDVPQLLHIWGFKQHTINSATDTIELMQMLVTMYPRRVIPPIRKLPQHIKNRLTCLAETTGKPTEELLLLWGIKVKKR